MYKAKCDACNGSGKIVDEENVDYCTRCGGSGLISGFFGTRDCPQCNGTGEPINNPRKVLRCPVCGGKGWTWAGGEPDDFDDVYDRLL